jgi:pyruvyl transferase EpsO
METTQLQSLKQQLSEITSSFDVSRRIIYVDYPVHTNVGDLLINLGSEQFFLEHGLKIWRRYNNYDFPEQIPGITQDDVFLLHGGGNLGDLWLPYQDFRESILERYPENRIIFLPQTVRFQSREREAASIRRMAAHRNLHVFVRGAASLARLRDGGMECVSLAPDMAHSLADIVKPCGEAQHSALYFVRRDLETSQLPKPLSGEIGPSLDWEDLASGHRFRHRVVAKITRDAGGYWSGADPHRLWYWHRDKMIRSAIKLFSRYETIVTNRLHAMLLGLLLGRKVVAWDNSYGKLSAYYEAWLSNFPELEFYQAQN